MQVAIVDNDMEFTKKAEVVIGDFCSEISEEITVRRFSEGGGLLEELARERDWSYEAYYQLENDVILMDNHVEHVTSQLMAARIRKELTRYWGK